MPVALPPYGERVISDYLRNYADLQALDARVVGKTPSSTDEPWVRVTQLDDQSVTGRSGHLHEFYFQLDCYAGADKVSPVAGQPGANLLARTVHKALLELPEAAISEAVVTGADVNGSARIPDSDVDEPARERFVVSATVWMHP